MTYLYNVIFYRPLYNGLIFLLAHLPSWADAGMAVIIFTVLVKLILFPLSKSSIRTQVRMKELEPKIAEIRNTHKGNMQLQSAETMKLYREYQINPFASIFLILIQLPIVIALYSVFLRGGLPAINTSLLYSFVHAPLVVNMRFFSFDIAQKSIILAVISAIVQFFQLKFSIPAIKPPVDGQKTFKDDLAKSMNMQMRYILPLFILYISYNFKAVVALYLITSNAFAIAQEIFVRRKLVDQSHDHLKKSLVIK
jgi:YidC/Oxa1 family membrane protein insertase